MVNNNNTRQAVLVRIKEFVMFNQQIPAAYPIHFDTPFQSLDFIEGDYDSLQMFLEDEYGVAVPKEFLEKIDTVEKIVDYLGTVRTDLFIYN